MALSDLTPGIPATRTFVCVGHGSFSTITDRDRATFIVPDGVEIAFWVFHGETAAGQAIEMYRANIDQVDARFMRGTNPDLGGFTPTRRAERRMGGVFAAESLQSLQTASAAAAAATAAALPPPLAPPAAAHPQNRRHAFAPGQFESTMAQQTNHMQQVQQARAHGISVGELAVMQAEVATNRGIVRPLTEVDGRSPRLSGLPQVIKAGYPCPNYRLTYDPRLCDAYLTGGQNSTNEGNLPAYLLPDHRVDPGAAIEVRGSLLQNFATLVAQRANGSVIHWAACRAVEAR